jgi:histone acetyltransferase MYST1
MMQRRVSSNANANESKTETVAKGPESTDNTDSDSVEEMPLDIGNHYLVRRADKKWHPAEIIQARFNETESIYEYYVHYEGLNRRLDEWVHKDRIMNSKFNLTDKEQVNVSDTINEDQSGRKVRKIITKTLLKIFSIAENHTFN